MMTTKRKPRVLARCPETSTLAPTHAAMSEREFARSTARLLFWCELCSHVHEAPREEQQLTETAGA